MCKVVLMSMFSARLVRFLTFYRYWCCHFLGERRMERLLTAPTEQFICQTESGSLIDVFNPHNEQMSVNQTSAEKR